MNKFNLLWWVNKIAFIGTFILIVVGVGFKKFIPLEYYREFGIILLLFVLIGLISLVILKMKRK